MKHFVLSLLTLLILISPLSAIEPEISPWSIYTELDMYLGLKSGVKYRINDRWDATAAFGINIIGHSQYCYSMFASYHTMSNYDRLKVDVNLGIIQGVFDNTSAVYDRYFYINPGATMHVSYQVADKIRLGAQGGMVLMIAYDQNQWGASLEPYVGLTIIFSE